MHCKACDTTLNDFELSRTYDDGSNVDLCNRCYSFIKDEVNSNADISLMTEADNVEPYDDTNYYFDMLDTDNVGMYDDRET